MPDVDVKQLRALLKCAGGAWSVVPRHGFHDPIVTDEDGERVADVRYEEHAELIAAMRNALPGLLDRIEALEAERAELFELAEMACQEPDDNCRCPGCSYAAEVNRG